MQDYQRTYTAYAEKIADIYRKMDDNYSITARNYGFLCTGCFDNCCRTRFYHHTFLEILYLLEGFEGLDRNDRKRIHEKAIEVVSKADDQKESANSLMCPLNNENKCMLYKYRPMICRLHGIPHELNHPVKGKVISPGCLEFTLICSDQAYIPFDRTPLYKELACLEKAFRQETGLSARIKKTVAEILLMDNLSGYAL